MPMTMLEATTVNKGLKTAVLALDQLKSILDQLNIIYDSEGGAKETIDQAKLDLVPSYSGLTKAQLDDGMYVLTNTLRLAITNGYNQLAQLAARYS